MKGFIAVGIALAFLAMPAVADDMGGGRIPVPSRSAPAQPAMKMAEPAVTAAPPPFVSLRSTSIGAGVGISWGDGTLLFEGRSYPIAVKGVSLGDLGAAKISAEGNVRNLDRVADFAGTYVAVQASGAAGVGAGAVTMRNANGVVITLRSELQGAQLTLGAEGLSIALQ